MTTQAAPHRLTVAAAAAPAGSAYAVRVVGALLALSVVAVHVADQGGLTALADPDWIGWSYRLLEVGGAVTAAALLLTRPARVGPAAGVLLGAGPFVAYVLSRTVGLPGDGDDVGNWGYWVGTVSLLCEAGLVVLCADLLRSTRPHRS